MAYSPTSTVSSSDLYAASEPVETSVPNRSIDIEPRLDQAATPGDGRPWPHAPSDPETRTALDEKAQQASYEPGRETPNGILANYYPKRKRDQEPDSTCYLEADRESRGAQLENYGSPNGKPESESLLETPPRSKRAKTDGRSLVESKTVEIRARADTLPAELWHYIFRFVPPVFLGRLLRVNRAFYSYLTSSSKKSELVDSAPLRPVRLLDAETIWAASRKRFAAGLPKPLKGLKELDMWRLLRGHACQICGIAKSITATPGTDNPWEAGPGDHSVREVDLLLSSNCPSFLLPAIPFAFVSSSLNYIPNTLLRESAAPPSFHIVKRFYKPHVRWIKQQLDDVRELGTASADEWSKGLAAEGKERINDTIRWEQWEAKGGLKRVNVRPQSRSLTTPIGTMPTQKSSKPYHDVGSNGSTPQQGQLIPKFDGPAANGPAIHVNHQHHPQNFPHMLILACQAPYHAPWVNTGPFHDLPTHRLPAPVPPPRSERSIKDANEAKAARRAEIERRCSLFDPPLLPHILNHMESFQAAIQISRPLEEPAWDVLKPRLLAQRAGAEKRDLEQVQHNELLQSVLKQRRYHDGQFKEAKESADRHWDSAQAPVRDRLGVLADAAIEQRWSGGKAVTKESCPKFAADTLLCVRQQFYDEVARATTAAACSGQPIKSDAPNAPPTQTLTLENMKWLFDTKIKPITETFQRELFLCNGCDDNFKFYGFEGVIQHYAAKHTTTLSMGSIVVYWRAEWPDEPPFNPEPSLSKSAHYKLPSPAAAGSNTWSGLDQHLYHSNGGGYSSNVQGGSTEASEGVSTHTTTPYSSSQAMAYPKTAYSASCYTANPSTSAPLAISNPFANGYPHNNLNGHPPQRQGNIPVATPLNGVGGHGVGSQYPSYGQPSIPSPQGSTPAMSYGAQAPVRAVAPRPPHFDPSRNNAAQLTESYQQQMDEMAKQARDIWYSTSSIKDLPASVRIYVVIHHMAARFTAKFSTVPSLAMFLDGLDNNAQMRPVRSLNGLACKICATRQNTRLATDFQSQPPAGDRRLYTLPHLLNHFRTAHLEGPQAFANPNSGQDGPKHDWTRDMIELPETRMIEDLVQSSGMDDNKLETIAWAFPGVFPSPLPRLSALRNPAPVPNFKEVSLIPAAKASYSYPTPGTMPSPVRDGVDLASYHDPMGSSRPLSQTSRTSDQLGEDEYDPHKPAYQGKPGVPGAGIERTEGPHEWQRTYHERQIPETADLSKLLYSATQTQPGCERRERQYMQQHDPQPQNPSSTLFRSEQIQSADTANLYGGRRAVEDEKYLNGGLGGLHRPGGAMQRSSQDTARSPVASEGAWAAEQFLQRLGQTSDAGSTQRPPNYEHHSQFSPISQWTDGKIGENARQKYVVNPVDHPGYRAAQATRELSPVSPMQPSRPASKNIYGSSLFRPPTSEVYHHANLQRAAANALIIGDGSGANGRGSNAYLDESARHRTGVNDRFHRNDHIIERPDNGRNATRLAPTPLYRDRSSSPAPAAEDLAYYQPRSPADEVQAQPMYRVRSPQLRSEDRGQRIMYDFPRQDRYEYVEENEYAATTQDRYAQRIEYVPVRMSNQSPSGSSRYLVTQPTDHRGRVPLEETYSQGAVYEWDGQLYRAAPRAYQIPITRGSAASPPSYPY
ncbi:MAG: hypothetical protein LQ348_000664 [Seirophora lacunosa]|nr:MAG: hypothetical protein LQ348_000664 [Seirophora lacunosa]